MRILMMDKYLTVGGVATFLETLGQELINQGHRVYLITASDDDNQEIIRQFESLGIHVFHFPGKRNNMFNALQFLNHGRRIIKQERIDILHSHHRLVNFAGILLSKVSAVPHLITFHVIKDDHKFLHQLWKKEAVVVPSQASKKQLIQNYGLDGDKVRVIHNAIQPDFETDAARIQKFKQGLFNDPRKFYVGYIGRLSKAKGVDVLLDSIPLVKAEYPNIEFRIFGNGEELPHLKRQCRANGLDPEVLFCGSTSHVNELLALLDLCVIPSRSESFCLLALECMRAGKPVVASAVGGVPEVISADETGILIEPDNPKHLADEIGALYENRAWAKKLGAKGKERFQQQFSFASFYEQYVEVYRSLIKGEGRG